MQLVGVGPVGLRASRADRGAAVPASGVDHRIGGFIGAEGAKHFTSRGVDVVDLAVQADWPGASADGGGLGEPCWVVVAGRAGQRRGEETGSDHDQRLL